MKKFLFLIFSTLFTLSLSAKEFRIAIVSELSVGERREKSETLESITTSIFSESNLRAVDAGKSIKALKQALAGTTSQKSVPEELSTLNADAALSLSLS